VLAGGFVAGLNAGFIYNTFPMMGDGLVPEEFMTLTPWWHNFFENIPQVQFDHRVLAITTLVAVIWLWLSSRAAPLPPAAQRAANGLGVAAVAQVALGIATLVLVVPIPVAALHQAGALVLFSAALWLLHELRRPA
jgi:cytochrome c oxidase assembly protein subunit 15